MRLFLPVGWLLVAAGVLGVAANPLSSRIALTNQHVDFRAVYQPNETNELAIGIGLRVDDGFVTYPPTNVLLVVAEQANIKHPDNPLGLQSGLPPGTPFGNEGDPLWILPQAQDPDLLYLGFSLEDKPQGTFPLGVFTQPLRFALISVKGPGDFFAWQADELGNLLIRFNSKDGITDADATSPLLGSHEHFNFGFTTNGLYEVTFEVSGRRAGGTTNIVSAPATFLFAVEPVSPDPPESATLFNLTVTDGQLTGELLGTAGCTYRLQTSPDLQAWINGPEVVGAETPVPVALPLPDGATRVFLRALSP